VTVAVTGPLACGKSTFVRMLGEMGADTVSADEIVHDLLAHDRETISKIVERFGEDVRDETGIDRKALARAVFGDERTLQELEDILHPLVREETDRRVAASEAELFVAEIPLLFEGGRSGQFDYTVAVTAPEERRLAWAAERGMGEGQVRAIEARQLPQEEKARRADLVVQNDGDLDTLTGRAREIFEMVTGGVGGPGDNKGGGKAG
jgi:dephospho-CoA kinase